MTIIVTCCRCGWSRGLHAGARRGPVPALVEHYEIAHPTQPTIGARREVPA